MTNSPEWFQPKKYCHIGLPINENNKENLIRYIKNKNKISKHGFFPFIHFKITKRQFRKNKETKLREKKLKSRDISYANHIDGLIYKYYSHLLSIKYEKKLKKYGISDCVTAYRKIPIDVKSKKISHKCNIDFADEVFCHIRNNKHNKSVIMVDVSNFFNDIHHEKLKEKWMQILNEHKKLPSDHYNVWKNITDYSYISEKNIFKLFQKEILVERIEDRKIVYKKKYVKKICYLRDARAVAYCDLRDIKKIREAGLINKNSAKQSVKKGIPQGSPISALLANIYMLDFDNNLNTSISKNYSNNLYRRYSDDILIVCDNSETESILKVIEIEMNNHSLTLNEKKTQIFKFEKNTKNNEYLFKEWIKKSQEFKENRLLDYLGFSFDGGTVSLKSSSLANYYRSMIHSCKYRIRLASTINNNTSEILFKKKLYKNFTINGARRVRKFSRIKFGINKNKFKKLDKWNWGNYLTYSQKAAYKMEKNIINKQTKKSWNIFHQCIEKFKNK